MYGVYLHYLKPPTKSQPPKVIELKRVNTTKLVTPYEHQKKKKKIMSKSRDSETTDSGSTKTQLETRNVTTRRTKTKRVSMDPDPQTSFDVRKLNFKVPTFSPDDPEIWFALLEGQFENFGITDDHAKFNQVITNLDIVHAKAVKDIIVNPPARHRYDKVKFELIKRLTASHENKVRQLLTHEELGDRKASQFLRHLQDLAGPDVPEEFLRSIWSNRLPPSIQTVLASQSSQRLEDLAELADRIQEITSQPQLAATSAQVVETGSTGTGSTVSGEIAELRKMVEHLALKLDEHTRRSRHPRRTNPPQRRRSNSRSSTRSASMYRRFPICWYHSKFASRAHKCQKPCDYKSGNAAGNQ